MERRSAMRILAGTKLVEAGPSWRDAFGGRRVVVDAGAGDGRWAYESARAEPASFFIALDADAAALAEYAFRAGRKPSRGGVSNALFVVSSVEARPPELEAVADVVRVNYPWGSLLRGLLAPEAAVLESLAFLAAPDARFELALCYDPGHDHGAFHGGPQPVLDCRFVDQVLAPAYSSAGLRIEQRRRLTRDEALAVPSTWGRRLLHARPRSVYLICGAFEPAARQTTTRS